VVSNKQIGYPLLIMLKKCVQCDLRCAYNILYAPGLQKKTFIETIVSFLAQCSAHPHAYLPAQSHVQIYLCVSVIAS
jgi:hypothetical protein